MRKLFQVGGLMMGFCLLGGCEAKVADQAESEFTGEDLEKQMEAMEAVTGDNEGGEPQ